MADQRQQPFRFRLPWLPGGPTPTPAPAPTPAPSRPPVAEPRPPRPATAGPSRPPFRPGGVAPTQPTPRPEPPSVPRTITETQTNIPKPTSPPKPEPTSAPRTITEPRSNIPKPTSPPKPEPPSAPRTITEPRSNIPKPTSPPKIESSSNPVAPTGPRTTTPEPKSGSPSAVSTATTSRSISPPKPPSPRAASQPPSPARLPPKSNPLTPSSSSLSSPRMKTPTKPENPPKGEPSEKLEAQPQANIASEPIQKPITSTPEPIIKQNGDQDSVNKPETVLQPVAVSRGRQSKEEIVHRKEMIPTSETSVPSYSRVGKSHNHNHKPAVEKAPLQKEIKEDISKIVHKLGIGQGKQPLEGDKQLTVITLAGENRGASMTLSNEARKRESSIHIRRGYRVNPDEIIETSTDGEESSKGKGKVSDSKTDEETTTKAYINSNVQGINNSLLFNGSVSTMNPGVRYVRSHNLPETSKGRHERENHETHKAECSGTKSEMLAYAPTVKRRCLRGLMLDSSDSDPEKPRRHGCRYRSKDEKEDENIGVL